MTPELMMGFEAAAYAAQVLARRQAVLARVEPDVRAWFERCLELRELGQAMAMGETCPYCLCLVPSRPGGDMGALCNCEPPRERFEEWAAAHGVAELLPIMWPRYGNADDSIRAVA